jgi:hypothetical protein
MASETPQIQGLKKMKKRKLKKRMKKKEWKKEPVQIYIYYMNGY